MKSRWGNKGVNRLLGGSGSGMWMDSSRYGWMDEMEESRCGRLDG